VKFNNYVTLTGCMQTITLHSSQIFVVINLILNVVVVVVVIVVPHHKLIMFV